MKAKKGLILDISSNLIYDGTNGGISLKADLINQMFQINMNLGKVRRSYFDHPDLMTASEYRLLHHVIGLEKKNERQTISQVAQDLSFSNAAVSRVIKQLLEKGWLQREKLAQDRRNGVIKISPEGLNAYNETQEKLNQHIEIDFDGIDRQELEDFINLGQKILEKIRTAAKK